MSIDERALGRFCEEFNRRERTEQPDERTYSAAFTEMHNSLREPLVAWYKSQGCCEDEAGFMADAHCVEIGTEFRQVIQQYKSPKRESVEDARIAKLTASLDMANRLLEKHMQKWQPMNTAPNDGRGIMVFVPASADNGEDNSFVTGGYCEDDGRFVPSDGEGDYEPSHWMPLPIPPTTQIEDEAAHGK
jgi:hypothetical protein